MRYTDTQVNNTGFDWSKMGFRVVHVFWSPPPVLSVLSLINHRPSKEASSSVTTPTTTMALLSHMRRAQPVAAALARRVATPRALRLDAKFAQVQLAPMPLSFGGSQRAFSSSPLVTGYVTYACNPIR